MASVYRLFLYPRSVWFKRTKRKSAVAAIIVMAKATNASIQFLIEKAGLYVYKCLKCHWASLAISIACDELAFEHISSCQTHQIEKLC